MKVKRILIANRGTIAVRIINTLNKLGIESVAVYHEREQEAMHARMATFSVNIGGGPITENFLNTQKLISVAKQYRCDAIHPGYGFLSENYDFAKACEENNLSFIGPEKNVIRLMGLKSKGKEVAKEAKVPILSSIPAKDFSALPLSELNFPLLIKAVAGGGGKGLRVVRKVEDLEVALEAAKRESLQYFANDELIIEPYIENARHIEVQVLGDLHGEVIHLYERECSIQRNHQKIIEEAPSVSISPELREKLLAAALRYAAHLNYSSAGTVEFLVSGENFWFLEMNTRIQVEHGVTEIITGVDIVEEQVHIANGRHISNKLKNISISGHAIEARIYAEDAFNDFRPSVGEIHLLKKPVGVRFDSHVENGTQLTTYFDSLLGKIIVHGHSRNEAFKDLCRAIQDTHILGINTNLSYLQTIAHKREYRENKISTTFLAQYADELKEENTTSRSSVDIGELLASFLCYNNFRNVSDSSFWRQLGQFNQSYKYDILIEEDLVKVYFTKIAIDAFEIRYNNKRLTISQVQNKGNSVSFIINNKLFECHVASDIVGGYDLISTNGQVYKISSPDVLHMAANFMKINEQQETESTSRIKSPLFGKVVSVKVGVGETVKKGEILLVVESMKTENNILSPFDGVLKNINVQPGIQIAENTELLTLTPLE
jgi:acetyl/propionyl-CoA carboxylase alpha subunit